MSETAPAIVTPPSGLTRIARERWKVVHPVLARRGPIDLEQLRAYCQVWARWQEAENRLQKSGMVSKTRAGRLVPSPLLSISAAAAKQVRELAASLGLAGTSSDYDQAAGQTLTRRELAGVLNVHMQTIVKWERDGLPVVERGRRGRPSIYRLADVQTWLEARETAVKNGEVDVAKERARRDRAQAVLAEQTYQIRARELLPVAEVEKAWATEVRAVRGAILATYTTRADRVHRAAVLDGVAGVERELKAIAHELLRELSEDPKAPKGKRSAA